MSDYYVATDGDDDAGGSTSSPWATLHHAVDQVGPGDTVHVRSGTYAEQLSITKSGSDGAPITFAADSGAKLDGSSLNLNDGEHMVHIDSQHHVTVSGFEVSGLQTSSKSHEPIGVFVTGSAHHITIAGNDVHDIKNTNGDTGSYDISAHGIAVYGTEGSSAIHDLTIDGNEVHDCVLGASESVVVNGNVDGFTITDNTVHDNNNIGIDAIGFEETASSNDQARNGMIAGNTVYAIHSADNPSYDGDNAADGIYVDGGKSITIERNEVYDCDIGFEIESEHENGSASDITFRDNYVHGCKEVGCYLGTYDDSLGDVKDCRLVNNTFTNNSSDYLGELSFQYNVSDCTLANNVFVGSDQNVVISAFVDGVTGSTIDYNVYWCPAGEADYGPAWQYNDDTYSSFSDWQGLGFDAHGMFADPQIDDGGKPESGSRLIGAGSSTYSTGSKDKDGHPRKQGDDVDIGAFEYQLATPSEGSAKGAVTWTGSVSGTAPTAKTGNFLTADQESFEGGSVPSAYSSSDGSPDLDVTTERAYEGTHALRLTATSSQTSGLTLDAGSLVDMPTSYSAFLYTTRSGLSTALEVDYHDAHDKYLDYDSFDKRGTPDPSLTQGAWTKVTLDDLAPPDGTESYFVYLMVKGVQKDDVVDIDRVYLGTLPPVGRVASSTTWTGSATGSSPRQGKATGSLTWTGSASGSRPSVGTVAGSTAWAGSASGFAPAVGTKRGRVHTTVTWAGVASGKRLSLGKAEGRIAWSGSVSGSKPSSRDITVSVDDLTRSSSDVLALATSYSVGDLYRQE